MSNLPNWPHASKVYSRAYHILENMARAGHVKPAIYSKKEFLHRYASSSNTPKLLKQGQVSQEMIDFIEALNQGNEELIKWHILNNIRFLNR